VFGGNRFYVAPPFRLVGNPFLLAVARVPHPSHNGVGRHAQRAQSRNVTPRRSALQSVNGSLEFHNRELYGVHLLVGTLVFRNPVVRL